MAVRIELGVFPSPEATSYDETLAMVRLADESGLDLVGIQDHPYQRRFLETWTLLTALAVQTSRVRFFTDVACLPLRPPAVLAKAAASLDVVTGGRLELGLGAGGFWDAIEAYGGPRRSPGEALAALSEAIDVVRAMWGGGRGVRYDGTHYRLAGAQPGPAPAHDIGIWLGVAGPRALALVGEKADGWVPSSSYVPPARLPELHARIDEAAVAAGREPSAVRRVYNVAGRITDGAAEGFLVGPVDQWVDELTGLATAGRMDAFVLWPHASDPLGQVRRFAEEVAPLLRDHVR